MKIARNALGVCARIV